MTVGRDVGTRVCVWGVCGRGLRGWLLLGRAIISHVYGDPQKEGVVLGETTPTGKNETTNNSNKKTTRITPQ